MVFVPDVVVVAVLASVWNNNNDDEEDDGDDEERCSGNCCCGGGINCRNDDAVREVEVGTMPIPGGDVVDGDDDANELVVVAKPLVLLPVLVAVVAVILRDRIRDRGMELDGLPFLLPVVELVAVERCGVGVLVMPFKEILLLLRVGDIDDNNDDECVVVFVVVVLPVVGSLDVL
jgi:hypothetical protein